MLLSQKVISKKSLPRITTMIYHHFDFLWFSPWAHFHFPRLWNPKSADFPAESIRCRNKLHDLLLVCERRHLQGISKINFLGATKIYMSFANALLLQSSVVILFRHFSCLLGLLMHEIFIMQTLSFVVLGFYTDFNKICFPITVHYIKDPDPKLQTPKKSNCVSNIFIHYKISIFKF